MQPRLVAITGPHEGRILELDRDPFPIGRHRSNLLQLREISVSREHCRIRRIAEGEGRTTYLLEDLDSRHGSFVNGVPVRRRELRHGDFLQVGESLFVFLLREADEPGTATDPGSGGPEESATGVRLEESDFVADRTVERPAADGRRTPAEILAALSPSVATAQRLEGLLRLTSAIHQTRGVEPLAQRLAELLPAVLPAQRTAVLLLDETGRELSRIQAWVREDVATEEGARTVSRTLTRRVLESGSAILAEDVLQEEELQTAESLLSQRIASVACAALTAGDSPLGVLYADTRDRAQPFDEDDLDVLLAVAALASVALENALHLEGLESENRRLREAELEHGLVGESPAMEKVLDVLARVAPTDSTVLLTGESGTGKELAARALHTNSPRAHHPFVAINCATLSENLLASELFGHEKGAFTGALATKPGKIELAHRGTVFLDEVAEIPPPLQAQLLRVLEERELERVGGTRTLPVDVRVVAATNRDLDKALEQGVFRKDLFYRLNVVAVALPPLRARRDDIPLLARHFARRFSNKLNRPITGFTSDTLAALTAYDWPGNVRELANAVERAVVLGQDTLVRPEDLPEAVLEAGTGRSGAADGDPTTYRGVLHETKRRVILDAVRDAGGNVTRAAERLDLHPNYLHRLISNLGLRKELDR